MPKVNRRQFLKVGGITAAALAGSKKAASAMELEVGERSYNYARVANEREPMYSVSPYGKLKNPVEVFVENDEVVGVSGDPWNPATRGRSTAIDVVSHLPVTDPDRITHPLKRTGKRGENRWKKITWDEALKEISKAMDAALTSAGKDSICLLRGEDSQDGMWQRFMHTFGSTSVIETAGDRNKKAGQRLTWGEEIETPDFANSRYILNFGSNLYETFAPFAQAVVDGRMDNHARLITFDPRMSMTAGLSDEWVPIEPGTDGLVALAMANVIMEEGLADTSFINRWTNYSADKLAAHLSQFTPELAEEHSGVAADKIRRIAIEFAKSKPATVFTYRGISSHTNGVYNERACMLLPVITGNVEVKGGYCLPRKFAWDDVKPVPPAPKGRGIQAGLAFPYQVKSGRMRVGVLFNYNTNPAYSAAASAFWREALKDEDRIPSFVCIASYMTETASLADIVLPEAMYLERTEPVTSPSSLFPWVGARSVISEPPEEVRELAVILRDIVNALDEDGARGYKKYWEFDDISEWTERYFEGNAQLVEEGGFDRLAEEGAWPVYGELDYATGKLLDDDGNPIEARYGLHKKAGFNTPTRKIEVYSSALKNRGLEPLPVWKEPENLKGEGEAAEEELRFVTFKTAYHTASSTTNIKYLAEKDHSNPCWINKETAADKGIEDGSLIRVTGPVGYMVTRARVTNAIHPGVVGIAASSGHWRIGRVASIEPHEELVWSEAEDADVHYNLWWRDGGVNPNDIIPFQPDPAGGGTAMSFRVKVEPAKSGDKYGDIKVDLEGHEAYYKKSAESAEA